MTGTWSLLCFDFAFALPLLGFVLPSLCFHFAFTLISFCLRFAFTLPSLRRSYPTHRHTPSHTLTHPHTPSHTHIHSQHPHTPLNTLTHPHIPLSLLYLYLPPSPSLHQTLENLCPWLLRYYGAAVILSPNKRHTKLRDLLGEISAMSYLYQDPITLFLGSLFDQFDFDEAQIKLRECQELVSFLFYCRRFACAFIAFLIDSKLLCN
jgi:hypothetical protein